MIETKQKTWPIARAIMPVLVAFVLQGCTLEQIQIGQVYTLYTPRQGACPQLEWQFVVNPQRSISGSLSTDAVNQIANLSGTLNPDDSFRMTATGIGGNRTTGEVTGQFTSQLIIISINGDMAGTGCDKQTFKMRAQNYFRSFGGGGGGGGR